MEDYSESQSVTSQKSTMISQSFLTKHTNSSSTSANNNNHNNNSSNNNSNDEDSTTSRCSIVDAETFLETYEDMLQHQKEETSATLRHLEPLLEILESKCSKFRNSSASEQQLSEEDDEEEEGHPTSPFAREFTYEELRQTLEEVAQDPALRFIASDLQWNTVLEVLSQTYDNNNDDNSSSRNSQRISWAEIVMCYRICIVSMQALDQTPQQNELRARVRQRSIRMIDAFRPTDTTDHPAATVASTMKTLPTDVGTNNDTERSLSSTSWVDTLFLGGALIFMVLVFLSSVSGTPTGTFIRGSNLPRSMGTTLDYLLIPGPIVSAYASDALKIPGPALSPFPEPRNKMARGEYPVLSPSFDLAYKPVPLSVRSSNEESVMPIKMHRALTPPSLTEISESFIVDETTSSTAVSRRGGSAVGGLVRTTLPVVAVAAGGTAAAGILAPFVPPVIASLGTTVPTLIPIGATVFLSTLLAHAIRDWFIQLSSEKK